MIESMNASVILSWNTHIEPIHEIIHDDFKNYGIRYPEQDMGFNISTRNDTK